MPEGCKAAIIDTATSDRLAVIDLSDTDTVSATLVAGQTYVIGIFIGGARFASSEYVPVVAG